MWKWLKSLFGKPFTAEEIHKMIQEHFGIELMMSMQRLDVKPGDILVLKYSGVLPGKTAERLRDELETVLKEFRCDRVIVLEQGAELCALRKENSCLNN